MFKICSIISDDLYGLSPAIDSEFDDLKTAHVYTMSNFDPFNVSRKL
jgi:hypothetical protein